jgi:hypothetical protein
MREEQQESKEPIERPAPSQEPRPDGGRIDGSEPRARERLFTTMDEENPMICRGID